MDVWCLPSKPEAKIHTRRNMTAEEKKAYKAKRLAGACSDCKRRRRKCDHDSSSPTQASSKKVKARKRSAAAQGPAVQTCAAPVTSFAITPATTVQDNFSFAAQDNFFAFESEFDNSMTNDMSFNMGFDDNFSNDFGFDLKNDFDLFPVTATNSGLTSAGMDAASWLAGSPDSLQINREYTATSRSPDSWPTASYDTAGVPLTPQSLSPQSLLMSRTQSGQSSSSSSLSSMLSSNDVASFNTQPVFSQETGNFVLHSPHPLLISSSVHAASSRHASGGLLLLNPQSVPPMMSPKSTLVSPTTSIHGGSRSFSSSPKHWPVASRVAPGSTSHICTDHAQDLTASLECGDQRPVNILSSGSSLISSLPSGNSTAAGKPLFKSSSICQNKRDRLKSTGPDSALPPDRGAQAIETSRRQSVRTTSRTPASEHIPLRSVQIVRPDLISQAGQTENTDRVVSELNAPRRRYTRTTSRTTSSEHMQMTRVQFVQPSDLINRTGLIENADRGTTAVNAPRRRPERVTLRTTSSRSSQTMNMQFVRPSDLIRHAGHFENSDHHLDMSKLCRLKHSSPAADDVCNALQASFDLPSLDSLSLKFNGNKSFAENATDVFQWIILLLFAAMHMFGFSLSSPSSGFGSEDKVKPKTPLTLTVDLGVSKETSSILTGNNTFTHQKSHPTTKRQSHSWQLLSRSIEQSVCRIGSKFEKMQSTASRLC